MTKEEIKEKRLKQDKKNDLYDYSTLGFVLGLVIVFLPTFIATRNIVSNREYSRGYCNALSGQVEGNVCIHSGVMVGVIKKTYRDN